MSIGTRIMEIRKKNNLSQEAFGDTLGVSRQAISKWEMDASIPDVEKLILISQTYDVSVGYILGMEENAASSNTTQNDSDASSQGDSGGDGDLTPEQLRMVEEIVERYLAALPKSEPVKKKNSAAILLSVISLVCCFLLLLVLIGITDSLDKNVQFLRLEQQSIDRRLTDLSMTTIHMESDISNRLEQQLQKVLEEAYEVIVDHGWEVVDYDLENNTVTIKVYADTRVFSDTTQAAFEISNGKHKFTTEAARNGNHFSAEIICPRSDHMILSLLLTHEGVTEVKHLDLISDQLRAEFPGNYVIGGYALEHLPFENFMLRQMDYHLTMKTDSHINGPMGDMPIVKAELVYYLNEEPYLDYDIPVEIVDGKAQWDLEFDLEIPLKEGDTIADVICLVDEIGRRTRKLRSACKVKDGQLVMWGITDAEYFVD